MGQYSALSDDFIIIAVSKAIVNIKTEKVEKYRRISRVVIGGQCLHRSLLFDFSKPGAHPWERRGATVVDGKDGTHSSSPDYTAPPG